MDYNFYLYSQLVHSLMINLNDWYIPYDVSYPLIVQSFKDFSNNDNQFVIPIYEAMQDYINDDETLYASLRDASGN